MPLFPGRWQLMTPEIHQNTIQVRVDDIAQLFHTLDPFPFREKDLDQEAEEYIVSWARELTANQPVKIIIHFPNEKNQLQAAKELSESLRHYFSERSGSIQRDLNELFRVGRLSLAVGIAILIFCFLSAQFLVGVLFPDSLKRLAEESLLILGWVANWRPLEIFLYDWWPLARRRDLYRRLSEAVVEARPYSVPDEPGGALLSAPLR